MNPLPQLCVYCGKDESFGKLTVEHFVPRCLWDKERPDGTLTVPAHEQCNKRYSADNDYFRDVLAISDSVLSLAFECAVQGILSRTVRLNHAGIRLVFISSVRPLVISASQVCSWVALSVELSKM